MLAGNYMLRNRALIWIFTILLASASTHAARAVPAFAVQTQQPCQACHIGGFGPQLTPFGREFKLNGYALRAGDSFTVPVSAALIASFVNTSKDQASPPAPHYGTNNNVTIDQINLFVAGGVGDHFGGFSQFTYDGVGKGVSWDNLDLRAVDRVTLFGSDVLIGLSMNNSPTVQDVWNSTPAWGFTYTSSALAPSPAASPLIAGGFSGNTLGITAFAWWDSRIYTEAGAYFTPGNGFLRALGASADAGIIEGAAPYARAAFQQDWGDQNYEVGAFALFANVHPPDVVSAATDDFTDFGIDASYQYMGDGSNIYTINARFTHEEQNLGASFTADAVAHPHNALEDLRVDASYYWHNTIGATVAPFDTWGTTDTLLYAGNRTFTPNSSGVLFQTDYTLFPKADSPLGERFNMRVGLQYTWYWQFNGANSNFDRAGTNASDNNTLRIFTWIAY